MKHKFSITIPNLKLQYAVWNRSPVNALIWTQMLNYTEKS